MLSMTPKTKWFGNLPAGKDGLRVGLGVHTSKRILLNPRAAQCPQRWWVRGPRYEQSNKEAWEHFTPLGTYACDCMRTGLQLPQCHSLCHSGSNESWEASPLSIIIMSPGLVWKARISKLSVCLSCIPHMAEPPEDSTLESSHTPVFQQSRPGI